MNRLCISCKPCKNQLPLKEIDKILVNKDDFTDDLLNMGYTKGYEQGIDEFIEWLYERRSIDFHEKQNMKDWFYKAVE